MVGTTFNPKTREKLYFFSVCVDHSNIFKKRKTKYKIQIDRFQNRRGFMRMLNSSIEFNRKTMDDHAVSKREQANVGVIAAKNV